MTLEQLILSIREAIGRDKDDALSRIANGTFVTASASDTGMAYQFQRGFLLGLVRASEYIESSLKKYNEPAQGVANAGEETQPPATEDSRPKY